MLPALGLANVGIVCLTAATAARSFQSKPAASRLRRDTAVAALSMLAFWLLLRATNHQLNSFFSTRQMVFASTLAAALATFLLTGRERLLALGLVIPNMLAFGSVNPIERGISVITDSQLFSFVKSNPELLKGKWLIFSDSVVASGFFAAVGCDVYTGTHYLPDIDHFPVLAAHHLDLQILNRLGYLDAHLRAPDERTNVTVHEQILVRWSVSPADPVLREIGIKYFAFDRKPPPDVAAGLAPLATEPVDGFWIYKYY